MRALRIANEFGVENLQWKEMEITRLHPEEILVDVKAMALNYLDILVADGMFKNPLPHTIGSDVAGVVIAIGNDVSDFSVGDRVVSHYTQAWQEGEIRKEYLSSRLGVETNGVFAEQVSLSESSWLKIPDYMDFSEAASLTIAGLTAYEALFNVGKLKENETVYLQGSGGVSIAALQLAKAINAKVVITTGQNDKVKVLKALGADYVINYKTDSLADIKNLNENRGLDVALDVVGSTLNETLDLMSFNGRVVSVGFLGGTESRIDVSQIIMKKLKVAGISVGSKETFHKLLEFMRTHQIKPVVSHKLPIRSYREAFHYLKDGKHIGKIVLTND